jgi:prephenate dehydratase
VLESVSTVERAELISEEVRIGERECVVRYTARVDRHFGDIERAIQQRLDEVFVWPDGVVLPIRLPGSPRIGYLGPSGTFSDTAARQLGRLLGFPEAERVEFPDFGSLVGAIENGVVPLVVLPITSSSSGLVDIAVAELERARDVRGGGVVDVPVRFDAYVAPGGTFGPGSEVFSHPQALRQCSEFIAANGLVEVPSSSTTDACRHVRDSGQGVALAAAGLDEELGTELARANVGNLAGALTRFLVIGRGDTFAPPPRADALLRSVWIIGPEAWETFWEGDDPRFDEVLRGTSGRALVVSTRTDSPEERVGARFLGTIPWSPRTPLVAV